MKSIKKIVALAVLIFLGTAYLNAIPANPRPFRYTQPDGSVIMLQMHGDEFCNWVTSNGEVVAKDAAGFYRKASGKRAPRSAYEIQRQAAFNGPRSASISSGEHKFLVILVQFSDLSFTIEEPLTAFGNQLNQNGYSALGAVGSARDYFVDNSSGQFSPSFDVYGPVSLNGSYKYYGADSKDGKNQDLHAHDGFADACKLLDSQIDFSKYDSDGNGVVDNIYFIYAGYAQSSGAGDDYIWPHASAFTGSTAITLDGVKLGRYACGEELEWQGEGEEAYMCGIGTFCHEFGHVLGLPDEYDTDYEDNGYNEDTMWSYSLMENGSHKSGGIIPPYLNWMERNLLGWMAEPEVLASSRSLSIPNISSNVAYKVESGNPGECFVVECRDGSKWDKGLASGMLVYHMDKSENPVGPYTAAEAWNKGKINVYGGHPCFYIIPSVKTPYYLNDVPFPGRSGVTSYNPVAWSGDPVPIYFTGISFNGSALNCNVEVETGKVVYGRVTDTAGKPVQGVEISVTEVSAGQSSAKTHELRMLSIEAVRSAASRKVVTDANGEYSADITDCKGTEFLIATSKPGYISQSETFTLKSGRFKCDFSLREVGEVIDADLYKYGEFDESSVTGIGASTTSYSAAARFSPDELASCVGGQIEGVSFAVGNTKSTSAKAYVIIEIGSTRVLTKPVENPRFGGWTTVNLKEDNIIVPRGESLLIGYGITGFNTTDYPLLVDKGPMKEGGNLLNPTFSTSATTWYQLSDLNSKFTYNFLIYAKVGGSSSQIGNAGYNYIYDPGKGHYKAGEMFTLSLVESKDAATESVEWYFDGVKMNAAEVELTAGDHTVEARMSLKDGRRQTVSMDIKVE